MRPVLHIESQLISAEPQPMACSILHRAADQPLVTMPRPVDEYPAAASYDGRPRRGSIPLRRRTGQQCPRPGRPARDSR